MILQRILLIKEFAIAGFDGNYNNNNNNYTNKTTTAATTITTTTVLKYIRLFNMKQQ